eukprot:7260210-Lingulodinium_polyedra.AAC.1
MGTLTIPNPDEPRGSKKKKDELTFVSWTSLRKFLQSRLHKAHAKFITGLGPTEEDSPCVDGGTATDLTAEEGADAGSEVADNHLR